MAANTSASPITAADTQKSIRAKVRMYRHGLGDCFLVSLPRADGSSYFILIDCGVMLGTPDAGTRMAKVLNDVSAASGGSVDVLVATHEHWDHLSGFIQAADEFEKLTVGQVWLSWAEDPRDELARQLARERGDALKALRVSANRLQLAGDQQAANAIGSLLDFFGALNGNATTDALEAVRRKASEPRYCKPDDPPVQLSDPRVRLFILGPPRNEKLIRQTVPSKRNSETYGLTLQAFLGNVAPGLSQQPPEAPFGTMYAIPTQVAEEMEFFAGRYWGGPAWRRIETAWLADSSELALQLDSATNNTSLVIAIQLDDGDVLLFGADAQVGNWLSWQDLRWQVGNETVTGPDLLKRTILYKVGHHGSHNATLREKGLDMMDSLKLAMVPVVEEMAQKKHWGQMPLAALMEALEQKTQGAVLRSDRDVPANLGQQVTATDLYFEVTL